MFKYYLYDNVVNYLKNRLSDNYVLIQKYNEVKDKYNTINNLLDSFVQFHNLLEIRKKYILLDVDVI